MVYMDAQLARQFRERWRAVEAVEAQEQQAAPIALRWKQLNALWQLAWGMGLLPQPDETENLVRQRWARLKEV
jgi:hypothetical protein